MGERGRGDVIDSISFSIFGECERGENERTRDVHAVKDLFSGIR